MKPVPTPRGTRPAPIDWLESRGEMARFCTRTVAGRTLSATPTTSGPDVRAAAALRPGAALEVTDDGPLCGVGGTTSGGPWQALDSTSIVAPIHVRIPQRRHVIVDAPSRLGLVRTLVRVFRMRRRDAGTSRV